MVYGPIAAFLVEMFPTRIRYTSMSLPYHIGNGWFGGMLPLLATALVAASGDIYYGLWYPIIVALMSVVIGFIFLRDNMERDIESDWRKRAQEPRSIERGCGKGPGRPGPFFRMPRAWPPLRPFLYTRPADGGDR
jgi:hypothetical protein